MDNQNTKSKFEKNSILRATLLNKKDSIYVDGYKDNSFDEQEVNILNGLSDNFSEVISDDQAKTDKFSEAEKNRETELVKAAKAGNAAAFGELYEATNNELFRYALYITGSKEDAEDAVQETLAISWKSISKLKSDERFRVWIFRILQNECRRILRHRTMLVDSISLEENEYLLKCQDDGFSLTGSGIIDIVKSLPPPNGQMVLMSVIGGFNSNEIAKIFSTTPSAVRSKLSRSLKQLKTILSEVSN